MRLGLTEFFARQVIEIGGKIRHHLLGILFLVAIRLNEAENRFIHGSKFRRIALLDSGLLLCEIAQEYIPCARELFLVNRRKELRGGRPLGQADRSGPAGAL